MSKKKNSKEFADNISSEQSFEDQAREQTGQQQIKVFFDEKNLRTSYANGFRPIVTAEEIILDFGLNRTRPQTRRNTPREIVFQVNDRIVLNYYSAKRLAISLSQIIRRYEDEFGELQLNAAKRRSDRKKN